MRVVAAGVVAWVLVMAALVAWYLVLGPHPIEWWSPILWRVPLEVWSFVNGPLGAVTVWVVGVVVLIAVWLGRTRKSM